MHLAHDRRRAVSQLGSKVRTRPAALYTVLDRLEHRDHITCADDRRPVPIELTAPGREAAAVFTPVLSGTDHRAQRTAAEATAGFHAVLSALTQARS